MQSEPTRVEKPANRLVAALVISLGLFLFAYTVPLASPAKEAMAPSLGLDDPADTWPLFTTYFLSWLIIIPPGAFLADRFGRKTMLLAGSLTLTAGMLLMSVAGSLAAACVAQFLNGAGAILLQIIGVAVITDLFAENRGRTLSLAVGLVGMVALLSPIMMGELLQHGVAWSSVYLYSAILPFCAFLAQLFCAFPAAADAMPITLRTVGELLRSPLFLLLIFSMLVYGIVEQGIPTWASSYVGEELGVSYRWQGFVVSAYFLIMSLARVIAGGVPWLDRISYPTMIAASAVLGGACLAAGTLPNHPIAAIVFLSAAGGAIAMIWPSIMTYAVEATGKPTATVFGLVVGIGGSTGAVLGSGALGRIKQMGLSYQQSLLTLEIPLLLLLAAFAAVAWTMRGRELKAAQTAPEPDPPIVEPAPELELGRDS